MELIAKKYSFKEILMINVYSQLKTSFEELVCA